MVLRKATGDIFLFSRVFLKDFQRYIDLNNPSLLRYLDDPYVEKYITEYYDAGMKGLLSFNQIANIYNMEIFLKNLEKNPNK